MSHAACAAPPQKAVLWWDYVHTELEEWLKGNFPEENIYRLRIEDLVLRSGEHRIKALRRFERFLDFEPMSDSAMDKLSSIYEGHNRSYGAPVFQEFSKERKQLLNRFAVKSLHRYSYGDFLEVDLGEYQ